ncbi:hypothetical protein BTVI_26749 [Pitangus sulphuratus]|nr:hypothetical protein BTVI_26749 [Pitangus sulphuratus]
MDEADAGDDGIRWPELPLRPRDRDKSRGSQIIFFRKVTDLIKGDLDYSPLYCPHKDKQHIKSISTTEILKGVENEELTQTSKFCHPSSCHGMGLDGKGTGIDTGGRVKEKTASNKGNNLEDFKAYAQLQNYKFTEK